MNTKQNADEEILITGAGIVCAIGLNRSEVDAALRARRSGIGEVRYLKTAHHEMPVGEVKLSDAELRRRLGITPDMPTVRTALLGMAALSDALSEAGLEATALPRMALINGTTVGGMDKCEQYYTDFLTGDAHTEYIGLQDCGSCTEQIADYCGRFGLVTTPSTACSSAAGAIILGAELLRSGRYERVAVGGSECLSKFHLNGFNALMILDREPCRPFDATRAGLNLGEGAAYLVLERASALNRRNAERKAAGLAEVPAIGRLLGYANACDAYHQTASSATGEGAYRAMLGALTMAGVAPTAVDYINAHGTGTPNNDASECEAMRRLFGTHVPPFSSTKGFTGHTTSASGSIEAVICLIAMAGGFVPVSLNCREPLAADLHPADDERPPHPLRRVLCNAFGFGGNDSSLLLGTPDDIDSTL